MKVLYSIFGANLLLTAGSGTHSGHWKDQPQYGLTQLSLLFLKASSDPYCKYLRKNLFIFPAQGKESFLANSVLNMACPLEKLPCACFIWIWVTRRKKNANSRMLWKLLEALAEIAKSLRTQGMSQEHLAAVFLNTYPQQHPIPVHAVLLPRKKYRTH